MHRILPFFNKRKKIFIPLFLILVIIGIVLAASPSQAQQVETADARRQDLTQSLSATGSIDSTRSVDLSFIAGGKLVYLGVQKGDSVAEGEVIARLDQRTAQKNLETTLRTYSVQRNTFEQTKDDKKEEIIDSVSKSTEIQRILQNNQYDLEKAVLSVELQALAKEQSVLTTPISGIVTRADVKSAGVNVGPTTTFTIADPAGLVFKMDVDEADIGKVVEGLPVKVILDAFPDQTLNLNVEYIDFATHTTSTGGNAYTVQASLPPMTGMNYRLGMSGDAEIILQEKTNVLTIPTASIVDDEYVYVKKDNAFEKRRVALGLVSDIDAQVINGLREGEKVALDPAEAEKIKPKRFILF